MAVEVALEDDLFFADLNRQISLLIDEEDDDYTYTVAHFTSPSQAYARSIIHHHQAPIMPSQYLYQERCTREMCKGTGVFIPQSSQPRRKYNNNNNNNNNYNKKGKHSSPSSYTAKSNKNNNSNNNNKQLLNSRSANNNNFVADNEANFPPAFAVNYINRY